MSDLVFFGIQGSGKGTQAKKLATDFGYDIFEAGGELRKIASSGSELGATVKGYIDVGQLVPHDIIMQVVAAAIASRPATTKILFDGIPRDAVQMSDFGAVMKKAGRTFRCVHFVLDDEEAKRRILGRAREESRADDADESIIERRMTTFREKTMPVIEAYARAGLVTEIDASGSVDQIYAELTRSVKS